MASERQSPETIPVMEGKLERLSLDSLHQVGGLNNYPYGYIVDDDTKAVIKMRYPLGVSQAECTSEAEYELLCAREEALEEVMRHGFTFTETNLLTTEYGAIDMLVECGKKQSFSEDQLLSISGLKGLFRNKLRESMQREAAAMTEMIKTVGQELWVVAKREDAGGYAEDPRIAPYAGVVLTERDKELTLEPIILGKDGKSRGLFPAGYRPIVSPIYIVTDRW